MNKKRICFNKSVGFIFCAIVIVLLFTLAASQLLQQNASIKTRASGLKSGTMIIGGDPGSLSRWPFMVRIINKENDGKCSGTLISKSWILTARHCVMRGYKKVASPGNVFFSFNQADWKTDLKSVKRIIPHEDSDTRPIGSFSDSDIALIEIEPQPIKNITPLFIALNDDPTLNQEAIKGAYQYSAILGYGLTNMDGTDSGSTFNQGVVPILSSSRVVKWPGNSGGEGLNLAGGYPLGGVAGCKGDSGGPLLKWNERKQMWVQIGIASHQQSMSALLSCASPYTPVFYTRISSYLQWITDNTSCNTCSPTPIPVTANTGTFVGKKLTNEERAQFNCRINNITPSSPSLYYIGTSTSPTATPMPYKCGYELGIIGNDLVPTKSSIDYVKSTTARINQATTYE